MLTCSVQFVHMNGQGALIEFTNGLVPVLYQTILSNNSNPSLLENVIEILISIQNWKYVFENVICKSEYFIAASTGIICKFAQPMRDDATM